MAEGEYDLSCVILGSFRFKEQIDKASKRLQKLRTNVLAPKPGAVISKVDGIKVLEGDDTSASGLDLEAAFVSQFPHADFDYIVAEGGFIGTSTAHEAYINLVMFGKPMFSSEPIFNPDPIIDPALIEATYPYITPSDPESIVGYIRYGLRLGYQLDKPLVPERARGLVLLSDPRYAAGIILNAEARNGTLGPLKNGIL